MSPVPTRWAIGINRFSVAVKKYLLNWKSRLVPSLLSTIEGSDHAPGVMIERSALADKDAFSLLRNSNTRLALRLPTPRVHCWVFE